MRPETKVEALAQHFARKLTEGDTLIHGGYSVVRNRVKVRYRAGHWRLDPPISVEEVQLAANDMPTNKATGPDKLPAEFYKRLPALGQVAPKLFTQMIEDNYIPREVCCYDILPFDKASKNPALCSRGRPISLLSSYMKLLESIIVRRLTAGLETLMASGQYAYLRQRSTELLLADLDSFSQDGVSQNKTTYLVGLDMEGAFDNANLLRLMEAPEAHRESPILCRFIGNWLTIRKSRVRLMAPSGYYYSRPYEQSRGVPQGGVLSPLLWLILINRIPTMVGEELQPLIPEIRLADDYMMQIYADDISIVLRDTDSQRVAAAAHRLIEVLGRVLAEIGLKLSLQQCKNSLIFAMRQALGLFKRGDPSTRWMKVKESTRMKALKTLVTTEGGSGSSMPLLPSQNTESIKLLGL